jgi:hypothetical protein
MLNSFTDIGRISPVVSTNLLDAGLIDRVYAVLIGQTPQDIPDKHHLSLEQTGNSSIIKQALMPKDRMLAFFSAHFQPLPICTLASD